MNYQQITEHYASVFQILEKYLTFLDHELKYFPLQQEVVKKPLEHLKPQAMQAFREIFDCNLQLFGDYLYSETVIGKYVSLELFLQENQLSRHELIELSKQLAKIGKNLSSISSRLEAIHYFLAQDNYKLGNITLKEVNDLINYKFNLKLNIKNFEITLPFFQIDPKYGEEKISVLSLIQLLIDDILYCICLNINVQGILITKLGRS